MLRVPIYVTKCVFLRKTPKITRFARFLLGAELVASLNKRAKESAIFLVLWMLVMLAAAVYTIYIFDGTYLVKGCCMRVLRRQDSGRASITGLDSMTLGDTMVFASSCNQVPNEEDTVAIDDSQIEIKTASSYVMKLTSTIGKESPDQA